LKAELEEIRRRRERLIARAMVQRSEMARVYHNLQKPVHVVENAFSYARYFKSPLFLTGLAAILIRTRWKKLARLPALLWKGWGILRLVQGLRQAAP